ncbi:unnamed protein product [Urochloa humidicola]
MGVVVASPEHADLPAMDPINDDQSDVSDADLSADEAMAAHQAPGSPAAPGLPAALPFPEIRNPVFPDYNRRTFIKFFQGHFIDHMDCPPGFSSSLGFVWQQGGANQGRQVPRVDWVIPLPPPNPRRDSVHGARTTN